MQSSQAPLKSAIELLESRFGEGLNAIQAVSRVLA
jgi:hypothetical protein